MSQDLLSKCAAQPRRRSDSQEPPRIRKRWRLFGKSQPRYFRTETVTAKACSVDWWPVGQSSAACRVFGCQTVPSSTGPETGPAEKIFQNYLEKHFLSKIEKKRRCYVLCETFPAVYKCRGSSSSETFFIHNSAPRYSVRVSSICDIFRSVSVTAQRRYVNVSWASRISGALAFHPEE